MTLWLTVKFINLPRLTHIKHINHICNVKSLYDKDGNSKKSSLSQSGRKEDIVCCRSEKPNAQQNRVSSNRSKQFNLAIVCTQTVATMTRTTFILYSDDCSL